MTLIQQIGPFTFTVSGNVTVDSFKLYVNGVEQVPTEGSLNEGDELSVDCAFTLDAPAAMTTAWTYGVYDSDGQGGWVPTPGHSVVSNTNQASKPAGASTMIIPNYTVPVGAKGHSIRATISLSDDTI
jgi:hypothetical protein